MAACGASDSVISHTSISEELQVPLLLFSISLHGGVMRKRIVLFFFSSFFFFFPQRNIIPLHYLSHPRTSAEQTLSSAMQ